MPMLLMSPHLYFQHATLLLDSALNNSCWDLCRDLVRFLKAIGKDGAIVFMNEAVADIDMGLR